jgi:HSP20 family molecular chaperone IbpA
MRSICLASRGTVFEDQISACYDNGELEVHVKKPEVEMPHQIQIGNGKAAIEGKTKT